MRRISFALTTEQVRSGFATGAIVKDVTRRLRWLHAREGDYLMATEKCMGLKAGQSPVDIGVIQLVTVRREPLERMLHDLDYGCSEVIREGFGHHPQLRCPIKWVRWFCASHKGCTPATEITRLCFRYVQAAPALCRTEPLLNSGMKM